ncbi:MAG: sulfatase [Verrucomicrobiota bacterium]
MVRGRLEDELPTASRVIRPNILFILIDDMGWKDVACTGSEFYETPNLDRLRGEGMLFTDAYAAAPVCSPTRASLLSGKYPARLGVTQYIGAGEEHGKVIGAPYVPYLSRDECSVARALLEEGYRTIHVGKWHLGGPTHLPEEHGFEVNVAGSSWGAPKAGYFSPYEMPYLPDGPEGEYLTDRLTDEAIRQIEEPDQRPWFLFLSHYAVHTPIQAPADLVAKYEAKAERLGIDQAAAIEEGDYFPLEWKKDQRLRRRKIQSDPTYAAMVENLDANIGRLLEALREAQVDDNTIVMFTSDNGGLSSAEGSPTCNLPLREGKGWMYEGGTREPLLVKWPGVVAPGSKCDTPVTTPDFYPTILEMAGAQARPEQHCDGESLLPLLEENGYLEREDIFWHFPHYGNQGGTPGSSIRHKEWKLIEFYEDGRLELYHLTRDPGETNNLVAEEPERTRRLHERLRAWREQLEALEPKPNPDFVPWREEDIRNALE